ncbi:MAG: cytochrome c [Xanthobacteraceae bacterium]|jgi:mono/diheme cytochrome c family protein
MKKNWKAICFSAVAALAVFAVSGQAQEGGGRLGALPGKTPPPTSPVSGNTANGKKLYFSYGCYACHGYNGETGARAFVGNWGNLGTEQAFIGFLRGRANVTPLIPSTSMPNFGEASLPDDRAKDIYAYIRSFKSSAPDANSIPTLNAIVAAAKAAK